jgi:hypothetical protein
MDVAKCDRNGLPKRDHAQWDAFPDVEEIVIQRMTVQS